jgi:hypothetical protein
MTNGNQTLLLSGSLLSNAAIELAQTLRGDLLQLLDKSVTNLSRFGISDACILKLQTTGFVQVSDLNFLQSAQLRTMGFPEKEVPLLGEICNEVRRTISVGSLSKILKNASDNITQIAENLPIKNTFIDFPSLFPTTANPPQPQSCPAYFLDKIEHAAFQQQHPPTNMSMVPGGRPPRPSRGASDHGSGNCKPCAWYHHTEGCRHETDCEFCHMCPEGEIKKRKKDKQKMIKTMKTVPGSNVSTPDISSNWLGSIFAK